MFVCAKVSTSFYISKFSCCFFVFLVTFLFGIRFFHYLCTYYEWTVSWKNETSHACWLCRTAAFGRWGGRAAQDDWRRAHILFYPLGTPGVGKTTLAQIVAQTIKVPFFTLSAVTSGVKDVREVIERAKSGRFFNSASPILFIDEIHRFSKSQQDSLLGAVEKGIVTLIGATTENPSFEVIRPLLSVSALCAQTARKGWSWRASASCHYAGCRTQREEY